MSDEKDAVLPYRVTGDDLNKLLDARARRRTLEQIRTFFSAKNYDGTLLTAQSLQLIDEAGELTRLGKDYALAATQEEKKHFLLRGLLQFEPYDLLVDAVLQRAEPATPLDWIEAWWATHRYGNSNTNRTEGSSSFARLVEHVGLGTYVQGRRGHLSRIEWDANAAMRVADARSELDPIATPPTTAVDSAEDSIVPGEETAKAPERDRESRSTPQLETKSDLLAIPLGAGRKVEVYLPRDFSMTEKEVIMKILDPLLTHLVTAKGETGTETE